MLFNVLLFLNIIIFSSKCYKCEGSLSKREKLALSKMAALLPLAAFVMGAVSHLTFRF